MRVRQLPICFTMKISSLVTGLVVGAGLVTTSALAQNILIPAPNRADMVHDFDTDLLYITDGNWHRPFARRADACGRDRGRQRE
jgi:hypothetical protein